MALEISKKDFEANPSIEGSADLGFMNVINSFLGNVNETIGNIGSLVDKYKDLRGILPNAQKNKPLRSYPMKAPPLPPSQQKPQKKQEISAEQPKYDKKEKATEIFNKIHEKLKPFIPMAKGKDAGELIKFIMKKDNKEKIINDLSKLL